MEGKSAALGQGGGFPLLYSSMTNWAEKMKEAGYNVNPPATPQEIEEMAAVWQVQLPPEIQQLYMSYNGQPSTFEAERPLPFELITVADVIDAFEMAMADIDIFDDLPELLGSGLPLWTDMGGNCVFYFIGGARHGMLGTQNHETPWSIAPEWRSLDSFYEALLDSDILQGVFKKDYPNSGPPHAQQEIAYAEAQQKLASTQSPFTADYWSANVLNLVPIGRSLELVGLLNPLLDDDEYVCTYEARVAELLLREYGDNALPIIATAIVESTPRRFSVIHLLVGLIAEHKTPEADRTLWWLAIHSKASQMIHPLSEALARRNYEVEWLKGEKATVRLTSPTGEIVEVMAEN